MRVQTADNLNSKTGRTDNDTTGDDDMTPDDTVVIRSRYVRQLSGSGRVIRLLLICVYG